MKFKKLLILFLCSFILVNSTMVTYKKAQASSIGALGYLGVLGGSLTLGGLITTTIAIGAALYGVSVVVDNWDDITTEVGNALNNATGEVKEWWDNITGSAVRKDDPVYTFEQDKATGKVINFFDYYKPPQNNNDKKIDVTIPVLAKVMEVLEGSYKQPILPSSSQVEDITKQYTLRGLTVGDLEINHFNKVVSSLSYDYLFSSGSDSLHSFYNYSNIPYLYIDADINAQTISLELRFDLPGNFVWLYNYDYKTKPNNFKTSTGEYSLTGIHKQTDLDNGIYSYIRNNVELTDTLKNYIIKKIYAFGKYTSQPLEIRCSDGLANVFPELTNYKMTGYNLSTHVTKTNHKLDLSGKTSISINQNDTLINELNNSYSSGKLTSTDKLVESINDANNTGIIIGDPVLEDEIKFDNLDKVDTETPTDPDDNTENTTSIIDAIKEFINNPLGSLKTAFDNFVTWIKEAWQDIRDIPTRIIEYLETHSPLEIISDIPRLIVNGIGELLGNIFIPDDAAMQEFINRARQTIENQTGILTYPLSLLVKFCGMLTDMDSRPCIINFPSITFMNYKLFDGYSFNFTQFMNQDFIKPLYDTYIVITDFIMIMWVVNLARSKSDEIIKGV